jgi:cyclohexanone monooxygenase
LLGIFADIFVNQTANYYAYCYWRQQIIPRIKDSNTAEKLAPKIPPYLYGTKRPALEQNYFEVFNQSNVILVDVNQNPIAEITQSGIKTKEVQYDTDVIIMATGFDAITGSILDIKITNDSHESLADKWKQGTKTYLGLATNGFPNLFYTTGPQGPTSYCNGITCAEMVGDWITDCLTHLRDTSVNRIEATKESEGNWGEHLRSATKHLLMIHTKSWYLGANIPGKVNELLVYPLGLPAYKEKALNCLKNNLQGFVLT